MAPSEHNFKVGDSVRVKDGATCPDFPHLSIAGWQGRVTELDSVSTGKALLGVEWDSQTLNEMPPEFIAHCERDGFEWSVVDVFAHDAEPAPPRDNEVDAKRVREEMQNRYWWFSEGSQGERIFAVIANAEPGAEIEAWDIYLRKVLTFPFDAKLTEYPEIGPLEVGDKVRVIRFEETDDLCDHGVLVRVDRAGSQYLTALCDLTIVGKGSPNYHPVRDYSVWYANQ